MTASNTRKVLVTCTIISISISIIENFYLICTYCTYIPIYFIKSCQKFSIVTKFIKFAKKNIKFPKSQILKNCQKLPKSPILKISKIGNFQNFKKFQKIAIIAKNFTNFKKIAKISKNFQNCKNFKKIAIIAKIS